MNHINDKGLVNSAKKFWQQEIKILLGNNHKEAPAREKETLDMIQETISAKTSSLLFESSDNRNLLSFTILVAALMVLKSKIKGEENEVISSPVFRKSDDMENNNLIFFQQCIEQGTSFRNILNKTRNIIKKSFLNQDCNLNNFIRELQLPTNIKFRIYHTVIIFDMIHHMSKSHIIDSLSYSDLVFHFSIKDGDKLSLKLYYNPASYEKVYINKLIAVFDSFLYTLLTNKDTAINDIHLLNKTEEKYLSNQLIAYKEDCSIKDFISVQQIFMNCARTFNDKIAAVCGTESITFGELDKKADILANYLIKDGVKPNDIVAIVLEPSIYMMIALLGVLKSKAAFLPIDPKTPLNRIKDIVKESKANELIAAKNMEFENICSLLLIDSVIFENVVEIRTPKYEYCIDDLVYVIYTSGSTGKPKGVGIRNYSLSNYVLWFREKSCITSKDVTMLLSSYSFDLGYTSLFSSLLSGATIHLVPSNLYKNTKELLTYIQKNKITYLKLTPSLFSTIAYTFDIFEDQYLQKIRLIVLGGEKIIINDVISFHERYPKAKVIVHYGPTETTIGSIAEYIDLDQLKKNESYKNLGKPIANTQVYICNNKMEILPSFIPGEILISGRGVAKGYLNHNDLSNSKFINHKINEIEVRLYKTGDLGYYNDSGSIEFIGRFDDQVKINGYRVELSEIEKYAKEFPKIIETVALVSESVGKQIILCFTANVTINREDLKYFLHQYLPDYMMPAHIIQREYLAKNANGKMDRMKLAMEIEHLINIEDKNESFDKISEQKEALLKIYKELFRSDNIGYNSNFFMLGGDSIKAIQIVAKLSKYGFYVDLADMFKYQTINLLGNHLKKDTIKAKQDLIVSEVKLSPIQIWFFEKKLDNRNHWNQSVLLYNKDGFQKKIIMKAINIIVEHHDELRSNFVNSSIVKQYNRDLECNIWSMDEYNVPGINRNSYGFQEMMKQLQSSLDIQNGPLIKLGIIKTDQGDYLLIIMHHLIVDGVSWRIFLQDFQMCYNMLKQNAPVTLPKKTSSYLEWVEQLYQYAASGAIMRELEYWTKQCQADEELISNKHKLSTKLSNYNIMESTIDHTYTQILLRNANSAYNTKIIDLLLCAFAMSMNSCFYLDKIKIAMEGHGRQDIIENLDLSRTIGWFTARYPIYLIYNASKKIEYNIKNIKELLREIPNGGIGYGVLKYIAEEKALAGEEKISFNYLGQFDEELKCDDFEVVEDSVEYQISDENETPYLLDINMGIYNEVLKISVLYNKEAFSHNKIKKFLDNYKNNIVSVANHCINQKETEQTPSDVGAAGLDVERFQKYCEWISSVI